MFACIVGSVKSLRYRDHSEASPKYSPFCIPQKGARHNSFSSDSCTECQLRQFFAPRDNIRRILLELLDSEKEKVQIAAFKLTDLAFAEKLIELHRRGVKVELLVDAGELDTRLNKAIELHRKGIAVFIFPCAEIANKSRYAILHHKFIVLHKPAATKGKKKIVVTGSLNYTKSAMDVNRENILVIISNCLANAYAEEFSYIIENETDSLRDRL